MEYSNYLIHVSESIHSSSSIEQAPEYLRTMHLLPYCTKYAKVDMSVCRAEHLRTHLVALLEDCLVNNSVVTRNNIFY